MKFSGLKLENHCRIRNIFSVDLEDYYMVTGYSRKIGFEDWGKFEGRIEENTYKLLDILNRYAVRGTFFVLGWVAEKYRKLVKDIYSQGHEIASHGYSHALVFNMTPESFGEDIRKTKNILEDITGERIFGYRAPSYSITSKNLWAIDILIQEGYRYDSSIFPIHHDLYGFPDFSRFPVIIETDSGRKLLEVPLSTIRVLGQNIPICGGGYFRLYPLKLTEWGIRHLNEKERVPAIFYIHPWELDPGQPAIKVNAFRSWRHMINIEKSEYRIRELLKNQNFSNIRDSLSIPY